MSEAAKQLAKMLEKSKRTVFFGGAGVSTESGIPDFRSAHGQMCIRDSLIGDVARTGYNQLPVRDDEGIQQRPGERRDQKRRVARGKAPWRLEKAFQDVYKRQVPA